MGFSMEDLLIEVKKWLRYRNFFEIKTEKYSLVKKNPILIKLSGLGPGSESLPEGGWLQNNDQAPKEYVS